MFAALYNVFRSTSHLIRCKYIQSPQWKWMIGRVSPRVNISNLLFILSPVSRHKETQIEMAHIYFYVALPLKTQSIYTIPPLRKVAREKKANKNCPSMCLLSSNKRRGKNNKNFVCAATAKRQDLLYVVRVFEWIFFYIGYSFHRFGCCY